MREVGERETRAGEAGVRAAREARAREVGVGAA